MSFLIPYHKVMLGACNSGRQLMSVTDHPAFQHCSTCFMSQRILLFLKSSRDHACYACQHAFSHHFACSAARWNAPWCAVFANAAHTVLAVRLAAHSYNPHGQPQAARALHHETSSLLYFLPTARYSLPWSFWKAVSSMASIAPAWWCAMEHALARRCLCSAVQGRPASRAATLATTPRPLHAHCRAWALRLASTGLLKL